MRPIVKTTLFLEPKAKARPRGAIVGRGKAMRVQFYPEAATAEFEKNVAFLLKGYMEARGFSPTKLPIVVFVKFYMANKRKIDVDNLLKAVLDGANEVAYVDDSQIQAIYSSKHYDKERPRIEFEMHSLDVFKQHQKTLLAEFIQPDLEDLGQL